MGKEVGTQTLTYLLAEVCLSQVENPYIRILQCIVENRDHLHDDRFHQLHQSQRMDD